ncbi:ATP-binding protein [Psychroserpens luteolus]|uniref:ATP-binding protein n=1 Tax=Psychroserpens luteolus TaxID=2855840 RepID=UPI001E453850|nr:ATP-binding protein [Psychroserpens luteolus]MCD2259023.1 ATP-binding protein [Psychroserpens luteolus]
MEKKSEDFQPSVNVAKEFKEISWDFGNPLEIFREAIHNSYDWGATEVKIDVGAEEIDGEKKLVIEITDDGQGMNLNQIRQNFWDLGNSASIDEANNIGEKGHGTKIYLRSEKVEVTTYCEDKCYIASCLNPFKALNNGEVHTVRLKHLPNTNGYKGTKIRIVGYNLNEKKAFTFDQIKDYLKWFTIVGTVKNEFIELKDERLKNFQVFLKSFNEENFKSISIGHSFPEETKDINSLYDEYGNDAYGMYVRKFQLSGELEESPDVHYDIVIYIEGQKAKESINPLLKRRGVRAKVGSYRSQDRYGIYLCKDFIPIERKNEWVSGFGGGSNAVLLLHGFINCQDLKLTANRGTVANTNPKILRQLQGVVKNFIDEIDVIMYEEGLYELNKIIKFEKTKNMEIAEYRRRQEKIRQKKILKIDGRTYFEPDNEAELFGFFMSLYSQKPEWFPFEPIDYNTSTGIDMLAYSKDGGVSVFDSEFYYVELKHILRKSFNHTFNNIRWLLCWNKDENIRNNSVIHSTAEDSNRNFQIHNEANGEKKYFLDTPSTHIKIEVIILEEILKSNGFVFEHQ